MQYRPASARDPAGSVERSLRAVGRRFGRPTCPLGRAAPGDGLPRVPPLASREARSCGDAPNTTRLAVPSRGSPWRVQARPAAVEMCPSRRKSPPSRGSPWRGRRVRPGLHEDYNNKGRHAQAHLERSHGLTWSCLSPPWTHGAWAVDIRPIFVARASPVRARLRRPPPRAAAG